MLTMYSVFDECDVLVCYVMVKKIAEALVKANVGDYYCEEKLLGYKDAKDFAIKHYRKLENEGEFIEGVSDEELKRVIEDWGDGVLKWKKG